MSGDTGPTENNTLKVGSGRKNYGFVRDTYAPTLCRNVQKMGWLTCKKRYTLDTRHQL